MTQHNRLIDRSAWLQQMTPATRHIAQCVESTLAAENHQGLLARHDIGVRLNQAVIEKATYGSQAVQQIARYLGMGADRLYKLCAYAESYSREQLEGLAARTMNSGARLTYNHLTTLLVLKALEERLRLIERTLEESLSVRDLRALIRQQSEVPTTSCCKNKSILHGLEQMVGQGRSLIKGFSDWQTSIFNEIDRPDRCSINPLVRNRIIEAQMMLDELSAVIPQVRSRLAQNSTRVDQLLG
jgi:hypothetical protein